VLRDSTLHSPSLFARGPELGPGDSQTSDLGFKTIEPATFRHEEFGMLIDPRLVLLEREVILQRMIRMKVLLISGNPIRRNIALCLRER
jgi:hypothetical protein